MDQHQRVAAGGRGVGAGGEAGRRDERTLTQREASVQWMGENPNQKAAQGNAYERKGIFLKLNPKEFEEIILKKKFISRFENANRANRDLVKLYNEIQLFRLSTFESVHKNNINNAEVVKLKEMYRVKMEQVAITIERIEKLNGKPVPVPPHFGDQKVIFSPLRVIRPPESHTMHIILYKIMPRRHNFDLLKQHLNKSM